MRESNRYYLSAQRPVVIGVLGLAVAALAAGVVLAVVTGTGWLVLAGTASALASGAAAVYYHLIRREVPISRSDEWIRYDAWGIAWRYITFFGPIVAGAVLYASEDDWRWLVSGLLAGAGVPGALELWRDALTFEGPGGVLAAAMAWGLTGLLVGPQIWLWSSDAFQGLLGLGVPVAIAILMLGIIVWATTA
jgi:hypothetical protein